MTLAVSRTTGETIDTLNLTSDVEAINLIEMSEAATAVEGSTDFAFGKMPRFPNNPYYLKGYLDRLLETVKMENGEAVYPEASYRSTQTSDPNGIFSNTPVIYSS